MKKALLALSILLSFSTPIQTSAVPHYINYSLSVINLSSSPTTYTITYGTPILPTGPLTTVSSTLSGTLTDTFGDGVSLSLVAGETALQNGFASFPQASLGVDLGPGVIYGPGAQGAVYAYGGYSVGPQSGPDGIFTQLSLTLTFTLSGSDQFSAVGRLEIETRNDTAVPEAGATAAMLGLGIAGLALARRKLS